MSDRLTYLVWPRAVTHTARGTLRSLLDRARDVTWLTGIDTERHSQRPQVTRDGDAVQAALDSERTAAGDPRIIVTLYTGRVYEDPEADGESAFGMWPDVEREHLGGRWREGLLRQVALSFDHAEPHRAGRVAAFGVLEIVLSHDDVDEEVVRLSFGSLTAP
jgi:hypothetical protein